jgi:cytosine/adenosine deaminase-related metal-dependent hydrolase
LKESGEQKTLSARWVVPIDGPPLEWGQVHIEGEKITGVSKAGTIEVDENLGEVILLPGLVNAHTHLDLTGFPQERKDGSNFLEWIDSVIAHRMSTTPSQMQEHIQKGIDQSLKAGVCLIGDISAGGHSWDLLSQSKLGGVVYFELLGLNRDRAQTALEAFLSWMERIKPQDCLSPGVSPHAPYSVRIELLNFAIEQELPLQMHLAETLLEIELLQTRKGPFADWLIAKNVYDELGMVPSVRNVLQLLDRNSQSVLVHGTCLTDFSEKKRKLVYCPRTHDFFNSSPHPMPQMLSAGWEIALGTDGLSSNPDLNVLSEARFVRAKFSQLSSDQILRMITINGAALLRADRKNGSLMRGKYANLCCFPIDLNATVEPVENLLLGNQSCSRVMIHGKWI